MEDNLEKFINKKSGRGKYYQIIIEEMLDDYMSYHYAGYTLLGIYNFVEENDYITDEQIKSIENIKNNPSRNYG